jgi:outer membrane receptor for ferrienterochelin and colicins
MIRRIVGHMLAVAVGVFSVATGREALAQGSTLSGKVTDADKNVPVAGANVQVVSGLTVASKAVTGEDGSYRITGLVDGTYAVVLTKIGYSARRNEGVVVRGATTGNFTMVEAAYRLSTAIVTTNRGAAPQKELDIPASIAVITSESFENKPSPTLASIIKNVPGVSVSQGGLMQSNIVSRGFNNAFSGAMLNLQDYRFAGVPSLRVNVPSLFTGTQDDIARIEILNGPASSLYGPNSANGVLHIITKSPFESQGTTLALDGGQQSLFRVAGRHAGVFGAAKAWGYKLSGEYFSAEDFKYYDPNEPTTFPSTAPAARRGKPNVRDFALRRASGEARLDYKPNPNVENIATVGYSQLGSGIEVTTAFGAAMGKNWSYMNFQDRFKYKNFFAQVFWNGSNSGNKDSTDLTGTYYLRTGIPVVDKSNVMVGQVQQSYNVMDWKLVGGLDYISTQPKSEGTIFGRNEGNTNIKEMGAYLQGAYPLSKSVELTTAVRGDQNDRLEGVQFSPRIAATWKRDESNTWRASFARAFNSPASFSFFLDQVSNPTAAPGFALRAVGNPPKEGWKFNRSCDASINTGICMRSPFTAPGAATSSSANAFPGFTAGLGTIAAALPDAAFGGAAQKAGFLAVYNNVARPALAGGAAPTPQQIGTVLRMGSTVVQAANVADLRPLMPSFNNTWEVGYKGILRDRVRLAVDLWYQVRGDVGAPIGQLNPLVFYDPASLGAFLAARLATPLGQFFGSPQGGGLSGAALQTAVSSYITSLTTVMAQLPQGSLALTNTALAPDQSIIATYSSGVGSIDVRGLDMAVDWQVNDTWMIAGSYSNQDKIVWNEIGGRANPLMSNSPKHRASLSVKNSNDATGFTWELGMRYSDRFPVNSGVLNSLVPNPTGGATYPDVPVQTLFDFNAAWRLPIQQRVTWSINIQNINDQKLPTFAGTAPIGRLAMTRLQWWF